MITSSLSAHRGLCCADLRHIGERLGELRLRHLSLMPIGMFILGPIRCQTSGLRISLGDGPLSSWRWACSILQEGIMLLSPRKGGPHCSKDNSASQALFKTEGLHRIEVRCVQRRIESS